MMASYDFLAGLIAMGHLVAGLFFLRYFAHTRDRLFLAFAIAFWLLAANQAGLALSDVAQEERSWIYLLRIAGFATIIVAVLAKNRADAR